MGDKFISLELTDREEAKDEMGFNKKAADNNSDKVQILNEDDEEEEGKIGGENKGGYKKSKKKKFIFSNHAKFMIVFFTVLMPANCLYFEVFVS